MLSESVAKWVAPDVVHYVIVDRRDEQLFQQIASRPRTRLMIVEDILPKWIFRVPGIPRVWMSLLTLPVRNWILQQIVKLSIANHVAEDVMLFVDSDTFFYRPYDPASEHRNGRVPLFIETGQRGLIPGNDRWHQAAADLLGLPKQETYDTSFIGNNICWRRDHALALQAHVAKVSGKSFVRTMAGQISFSEYVLYGMFVTEVLKEKSGQWHNAVTETLCYWDTTPLDETALRSFKQQLEPHHHSVMVSTKSGTPVSLIRKVFFDGE